MEIGPGWDCGQCRLGGLNGLLLHCRDSMKSPRMLDGSAIKQNVTLEPHKERLGGIFPSHPPWEL